MCVSEFTCAVCDWKYNRTSLSIIKETQTHTHTHTHTLRGRERTRYTEMVWYRESGGMDGKKRGGRVKEEEDEEEGERVRALTKTIVKERTWQ